MKIKFRLRALTILLGLLTASAQGGLFKKSALDLAEATFDAARARLLKQKKAASTDKYDVADFERSVRKSTPPAPVK